MNKKKKLHRRTYDIHFVRYAKAKLHIKSMGEKSVPTHQKGNKKNISREEYQKMEGKNKFQV